MEEPSSPMTSHLLHPNLLHSGAAASPLASPAYPPAPDACLFPKSKTSLDPAPRGITRPRPRYGFRPPSFQRASIGMKSSLKENKHGNEDDANALSERQCVTTKNPSLLVDCHVFSPASSWDSQPITPSPHSSSLLRDGSNGWEVPNNSSLNDGGSSPNEFGQQGKRIGCDGTTQTPSMHLLKPTASSLGHRVQKIINPQTLLSTSSSFHSSRIDPPKFVVNIHDAAGGNRAKGGHMATMTFDTSPLDPFGKLNRSSQSVNTASDDDEDMANMTQNSSELMLDLECNFESTEEEGNTGRRLSHLPGCGRGVATPPGSLHLPRAALHRCASWSPGPKTLQRYKDGYKDDGLDNSQRLRSHNMDPVASQLLARVVHEEEQGGTRDRDPLSLSSHSIGLMAGASSVDDAALCHSPIPPSDSGNFCISASMPDLLSPAPTASKKDGGGSKTTLMIVEEAPVNYPMSPVPLFRDVSDSLLDVKTEDDIKCLPRPVPRKFMPTIAASPSRRSSLPRHL